MSPEEKEIWRLMMSGFPYNAAHPFLSRRLQETRLLLHEYNNMPPQSISDIDQLLRKILGKCGLHAIVNPPFHCDYGCNIRVGENFFANFNLTVLDEAIVTIGDNAFLGPNVSIYTPCHPTDPAERNRQTQWSLPVTIGDNVWIGGSVTLLPGVTIGDGVTIGAGSVVVHDIPSHSVAVGNPCHVVKTLIT